jgi:hypothetical protein
MLQNYLKAITGAKSNDRENRQYMSKNLRVRVMVFNATFNNISVILWRSV